MTNEFRGSAYSLGSSERTEIAWGIPQRFLCAISEGGQEVSQQHSFLIHKRTKLELEVRFNVFSNPEGI
jgi:hypothetical protein